MSIPVFEEMSLDRPAYEDLKATYQKFQSDLADAASVDDARDVLVAWDETRNMLRTWSSLTNLRFNQDTTNEAFKVERDYADELSPKISDLDTELKKALLKHPHRNTLQKEFGDQAFTMWEFDTRSFDPVIEEDAVQEAKLCAEYTELLASARFDIDGESCNLSMIVPHTMHPDRDHRKKAQALRWQWMADHSEKLDDLYDQLVKLRHGMAKKLGLKDYIELGYLNMHRIDYNRQDVERFRQQIRDLIVPLASELKKQQQSRLKLDKLYYWDEPLSDLEGNPKPKGDYDWMVARAQEMFDGLGYGLDEFFALMCKQHLMDLKSRDGKAGGGFCTSFPVWGVPFIFANFNGTKGDVEVFTHEMGHAFQNYCSREQRLADYHWPTYESAEIHSMSLEYLTWPWMENFFGKEDGERFKRIHLSESLAFLPYGTSVDHFQHLVYENPDATPAERKAMWREVEQTYQPWKDYGDLPHLPEGGMWQLQRHIYLSPFYYIDYVLAETCALQFWARAEDDREAAMKDYLALCKRGGEAPFQELVRGAGLTSPFDEGCLSGAVNRAKNWLAGVS